MLYHNPDERYHNAIETLTKQIYEWNKLKKFETVAEHITALLNVFESKKPNLNLAKAFIQVINDCITGLINEKKISILQAVVWVGKTVRVANAYTPLKREEAQLMALQKDLSQKLLHAPSFATIEEMSQQITATDQISLNCLKLQYKKYFDQMMWLLSGKPLPILEITELVEKLKIIIFSRNSDNVDPDIKNMLKQTILLCRHYALEDMEKNLFIVQTYWNSSEVNNFDANSTNETEYEEKLQQMQAQYQLQIDAVNIISGYQSDSATQLDDLSSEFILQLLQLSPVGKIDIPLQVSTLKLMHKITEKFIEYKDIDLAYKYLEDAIGLSEKLNLSEQRNNLILLQADLLAVSLPIQHALGSLRGCLEAYFDNQSRSLDNTKTERQTSELEARVIYYQSKDWIIKRLMNSSEFEKTFNVVVELGERLIAANKFDLAWDLYASIQPLLTQTTQNYHTLILIQFVQISRIKSGSISNVYTLKNDWKKYQSELTSYRNALRMEGKLFAERQQTFTESVKAMLANWLEEIVQLLGPAPDEFCILVLGSMSRGTLGPFSDIECAFLARNKESADWDSVQAKYFVTLYNRLRFKVASVGENYANRQGFHLDKQGDLTVPRLRGTPEWLFYQNHPAKKGVLKDDEITFSLLNPAFLYGSRSLLMEFQKLQAEALKKPVSQEETRLWEDVLATAYLTLHCGCDLYLKQKPPLQWAEYKNSYVLIDKKTLYYVNYDGEFEQVKIADINKFLKHLAEINKEKTEKVRLADVDARALITANGGHVYFKKHDPFSANQNSSSQQIIDIKNDYLLPLMCSVADICFYHRMRYTNTAAAINQLLQQGKIAAYFGEAIKKATLLAEEIRMRVNFFYGKQNDKALPYGMLKENVYTLSQDQQRTIDLIAWGVMRPLRFVLESLQREDDSCLFNPILSIIKQAKNTEALKVAVQCNLFALVLADADVDTYRLAYLPMPPEAREIFLQLLLQLLQPLLSKEKLKAIQKTCFDCPLPNGVRENQRKKQLKFDTMIANLIVEETREKRNIKLRWINSVDEKVEGDLHPDVVNFLIDKGYLKNGELQITREKITESDGRHLVIRIHLEINHQLIKIHLKIYPEFPGMESAADELTYLLTGSLAPYVRIARFEVGGKAIPVLLSQTIVGIPLHKVIPAMGDKLSPALNQRTFHQGILSDILVNPEDQEPSNIIAYKDKTGMLRLIPVDNERSFCPAVVEEEKGGLFVLVPVVKNIRYCIDRMKEKIDPVVRAEILNLNAFELFQLWLIKLKKIEAATNKLFTLDEMKSFFPKNGATRLQQKFIKKITTQGPMEETVLQMIFKDGDLSDLHGKIIRLQAYLNSHPEATLLDLLLCAEPYLANYYLKLLETFPRLDDRFEMGFKLLYDPEREASGALKTQKTTGVALQTLYKKPPDVKTILGSKDATLEMAEKELKHTHNIQQKWEEIYNDIMQQLPKGCTALFQLRDARLREIIVNKIDFAKITSTDYQQLVLNTLIQSSMPFRSLKLLNCPVTDEMLGKLLANSLELKILVLDNCSLLTGKTILNIAKYCLIIEKLTLNNLTLTEIDTRSLLSRQRFTPIGTSPPVVFAELRYLDISGCKSLSKLYIEAPRLVVFYAKNCIQLKEGKLRSRELRDLALSNCISLTTEELSKFVTNFPYLQTVALEGCEKIEKRAHYMKFPYLLRINLDVVNKKYLDRLTVMLERFRNIADEKQVSQLLAKLHDYFDAIERWMPMLIRSLNDPSAEMQKEAALAIQVMSRYDHAMDQLNQLLSIMQPDVCVAAAITLYNINEVKDLRIIWGKLQEVFSAKDKDLMKYAILLFNQYGSEEQTLDTLLEVLEKGSPTQRKIIIDALVFWPGQVHKLMNHPICNTLKQIILKNDEALRQIFPKDDERIEYQASALYVYYSLEKKHNINNFLSWVNLNSAHFSKIIPNLLTAMTKFAPESAFEIRNSVAIKSIPDQEIQNLITQIKNEKEWSKRCKYIQRIGDEQIYSEEIESLLIGLQTNGTPAVRIAVVEALGRLAIKNSNIDKAIARALYDQNYDVICAAAKMSSIRRIFNEDVRKSLLTLMFHQEQKVREAVLLAALENINEFNQELFDASFKVFSSDSITKLRCIAVKILAKLISLDTLENTLTKTCKQSSETPSEQGIIQINPTTKSLTPKFVVARRNSDQKLTRETTLGESRSASRPLQRSQTQGHFPAPVVIDPIVQGETPIRQMAPRGFFIPTNRPSGQIPEIGQSIPMSGQQKVPAQSPLEGQILERGQFVAMPSRQGQVAGRGEQILTISPQLVGRGQASSGQLPIQGQGQQLQLRGQFALEQGIPGRGQPPQPGRGQFSSGRDPGRGVPFLAMPPQLGCGHFQPGQAPGRGQFLPGQLQQQGKETISRLGTPGFR